MIQRREFIAQPLATPPLPAEALSFPSPQHMAPDLLLHPVLGLGSAAAWPVAARAQQAVGVIAAPLPTTRSAEKKEAAN
jgi:hypothetical protein